MLLTLASRNVFRNKRRSLLTILLMAVSYGLISISFGLVEGSYNDIINSFTSQNTGHIQVANKDFVDNPSLYKTIKKPQALVEELSENSQVAQVTSRIKSGALAFGQSKSLGVEVVGIDVVREKQTTHYDNRLLSGRAFKENDEYKALVGKKVAKILNLKIGDEIVLISQGADGSIANDVYPVIGTLGTEFEGVDDFRVYLPLKTAEEFYSLYGQAHEITLLLKNFNEARNFSQQLQPGENLMVRPWQEVEADFYRAMETDKKGNNVSLSILMIIVGVTVLNTILMSTLERTKEFGVLKALGTLPGYLFRMILLESLVLAVFGILLGVVIGYAGNYYLMTVGIQLAEPISFAGMTFSEYRSAISLQTFLIPAIIIVITTFIASLYPGLKAARMSVAEALRDF